MWHIWGRREMNREFWWGNLKQTDHLQDLDLDMRIILRWVLGKWWDSMDWFGLAQQLQVLGCHKHCNVALGSVKCSKFLVWLRNYWLQKMASASWSLVGWLFSLFS